MPNPYTQKTDVRSRFRETGASVRADSARGFGCVTGRVGDTRTIAHPVAA